MNLAELFESYGIGVMASANASGRVNTAIYARPHIIDQETLVWGVTAGRTLKYLQENPFASYLFKTAAPGYNGVRIDLELVRLEDSGEQLAAIRENTNRIVGPHAGLAVTHAAWFRIVATRPLL